MRTPTPRLPKASLATTRAHPNRARTYGRSTEVSAAAPTDQRLAADTQHGLAIACRVSSVKWRDGASRPGVCFATRGRAVARPPYIFIFSNLVWLSECGEVGVAGRARGASSSRSRVHIAYITGLVLTTSHVIVNLICTFLFSSRTEVTAQHSHSLLDSSANVSCAHFPPAHSEVSPRVELQVHRGNVRARGYYGRLGMRRCKWWEDAKGGRAAE